jgi:ACS family tartrate transporter-like MFS transporter
MTEATSSDETLRRKTVAKVTRRLIPFIFLCYVVAYVDRVNLGFASSAMKRDLQLSDSVLGWGAGLFFFGYFLFEIPSNLILHRVGARLWIARIMIVWGLVSMAMSLAVGKWSFYALRVALGLSEAGFFPGIVLYLTYWVPARERAKTGALFMIAAPVAMIVGGPISGALLELDGALGFKGWQWLFVLEGLPAVVLGFLCLRYLTSRPEQATWLTSEEKALIRRELEREALEKPVSKAPIREMIKNPRVWLLCAFYFLNTTVTYGIFLWIPRILESASGLTGFALGMLTASTFVPALAGMLVICAHSDKTGERRWHTAACALTGAVGLLLAAASTESATLIALSLALCHLGQRTIQGVFWTIPPAFLGGIAAAAGIGFINAVGNLGGQLGPFLMGRLKDTTGGYAGGLVVLALLLVVEAGLVLSFKMPETSRVPAHFRRSNGVSRASESEP